MSQWELTFVLLKTSLYSLLYRGRDFTCAAMRQRAKISARKAYLRACRIAKQGAAPTLNGLFSCYIEWVYIISLPYRSAWYQHTAALQYLNL